MKNIALPSKDAYQRSLIRKVESVIKRMRWKAHFFLHGNNNATGCYKFGLNSRKCPPQIVEMREFEDDLLRMIENIKFRNVNDQFQASLATDLKKITSSPNLLIFADKTENIYEMKPDRYNQLLTENVTKNYKLADNLVIEDINQEMKAIANELEIGDRIETMAERQAFISLKDHKENFENHPTCRLINPAKSNLGKVSKIILDRINTTIRNSSGVNQWRNSSAVIEWFKNINNKNEHAFLSFDIVDFYPSITENLLNRAISWASQHTTISDQEVTIIKHVRKSLLFNAEKAWVKRDNASMFYVTMGSYDGAEICELVGLFILDSLARRFGKENVGLYRDDGLALLKNTTGRLADRSRNDLIKLFEEFGLKITTQTNQKTTNFLDITLNLNDGKFHPYHKPNNRPLYVHSHSNHPPSIIKEIPSIINKRISQLSSDQSSFQSAAPIYEEALRRSKYQPNLQYLDTDLPTQSTNRRKRQRNIIWFNPPFSRNIKTNIGRTFLNLIDKHFPASSHLHRIFNRNTVKISYSCMPNMRSSIMKHNADILSNQKKQPIPPKNSSCNCRNKNECPLPGNCLATNVIYKAVVTTTDNTQSKEYIGMTANEFKQRYRNHQKSFRDDKYENETELSKYVWSLKKNDRSFNLSWAILGHAAAYRSGSKQCNLCLEEKLHLVKSDKEIILNKRTELVSKCRHENKFYANNQSRAKQKGTRHQHSHP